MVEETTTRVDLKDLERLVDDYEQARLRENAAKKDKEEAREAIIEAFSTGGMRNFRDEKDRVTTVDTRRREYISVKEAKATLSEDLITKLVQTSTSLVVNVRYKPQLEESEK